MPVKTGRIEVALAIEAVSNLVNVTIGPPASVKPSDLFKRTFNDPKVGIDDFQMPEFKEKLKGLLPEISDAIDKIKDNSNLNIGDVAEVVRLALLLQAAHNDLN